MPTGTGISFDTSAIKNAEKAIDNLVKKAETGIGRINKAWKDMTKDGLNHFIQRVDVAQRSLAKLSSAKINVKVSGSANDLTKLGNSASKALVHVNKLVSAMQQLARLNINIIGTGGGSSTAADAQKINYLQQQVKLLQDQLKTQQDISKALGNQVTNTNKVNKSMNSLGDTARKVRQIAGTIFSVQALMGYANKLLQIRGEFEMQHRSLQVLLQDIDEANALWDKTVALAVKSPFRVKELVTYTKQLAAYRIEADKLYETNKMLADVSAGLGVDMNRLILAFGQVKAANFLRGTELRQFSEAGVNMLEELAKRFTDLEGRAVSVGDVFERVSKRMVSFKDVEAVFQTITSEGGTFYKMQEKQSETLKGMIMNLKDSIDLMFNEIGISNDSGLKRAVDFTRELVRNWRKLKPVIEMVGVSFLAYFGVKTLTSILKGVQAIFLAFTTHPLIATLTVISAIAVAIWRCKANADALSASLNQVDVDITKQLEESLALYRQLAESINDVTATEKEQTRALKQLQSRFEDILPSIMLDEKYIRSMADGYEEVTNAMMNYYNAKAVEQKKSRIESQFAEELEGIDIPELINSIRSRISSRVDIDDRLKPILLSGVSGIVNEIVQDIKSGALSNDFDAISDEIQKRLEQFADVELPRTQAGEGIFRLHDVKDMIKTLDEYRVAIDNVMGLPFKTYAEANAAKAFLPEKENIEEAKNMFKQIASIFDNYSKQTGVNWEKVDEEVETIFKRLPQQAEAYAPALQDAFARLKEVAMKGSFEFTASLQGIQQGFLLNLPAIMEAQANAISSAGFETELQNLVANMRETLESEAKKLNVNDFQRSITDAMRVIAQETGVSVDEFTSYIPEMGESISNARQEVAAKIELLEGDIKKWNQSLKVDQENLNILRPEVFDETQSRIDAAQKLLEALEVLRTYLGDGKDEKGRTDNTIEERIKVVDQMNAKFKELNKTLTESESMKGAFDAYKDAFATAYGREDVRSMSVDDFVTNVLNFPNEDDVVKWLDNLAKTVSDKEDKIKVQLAKGKFEMDVDVRVKEGLDEQLKKEIEDMFDNYELSLDLKKLNIPSDLAKSLFGVDSIDLEAIRDKVTKELSSAKETKGQENRVKELEKFLEKINDMEDKAQVERLKNYLKYTRDAVGERAKIKIAEMTKLQEIDETFTKAMTKAATEEEKRAIAEQRRLAEDGVKKEAADSLSKLDWDAFRSSETFIGLFKDLDNVSDDLLQHAIDKIKAFQDQWADMPISDAKEMINKLNELELALLDTGKPFADYVKANKDIEAAMKSRDIKPRAGRGKSQLELRDALGSENKAMDDAIAKSQLVISVLETINNANAETKQQELERLGINKEYLESLGLSESVLTNTLEVNSDLIDDEREKITITTQNIAQNNRLLRVIEEQKARLTQQADAIGKAQKMANDLYDAFSGLAEALGADEDSPESIFADMGMSMLNTVLNTIQLQIQLNAATIAANELGIAMNTAMGFVGWIVMGVQLLTQAITAIAKVNDNRIVSQLEDQAAIIERQRELYEELEEKINGAYSVEQLRQYNKEMERNIELEIQALEASIALEKSRKKADEGQIADWQKEITEARKRLAEYQQAMAEEMGGIFDITDFTSGFVDAWWDAMDEGMSGLDALGEHFEETMKDMVKKHALFKGAQEIMKQVQDVINADIADNYQIDDWQKIWDVAKKANVDLDAFLQGWYDMFGTMSDGAEGGLSALQKGIQGITEDTAQVIESYLNSIRGYVSEQVTYTKRLYEMFDRMSRGNTYGLNVRMIS